MENPDAPLYRVPDDIAWIDGSEVGLGEQLYLTRLPSGETILLEGTARMIWHAAVTVPDSVEQVAVLVAREIGEIESEVARFRDELLVDGFLAGSRRE